MWRNSGARGSALEALVEYTNERLRRAGLCRIDKIATPIKTVEIDEKGTITKAYFEKKSTVDFIGIVQGVFVAYDTKETNLSSLPLKNIHEHQVDYLLEIEKQGGLGFLIVHFKKEDEYYLIPTSVLSKYFFGEQKNKKSISYKEMSDCIKINFDSRSGTLGYLDALNEYVKLKSK